jgi:hypothetical protein
MNSLIQVIVRALGRIAGTIILGCAHGRRYG